MVATRTEDTTITGLITITMEAITTAITGIITTITDLTITLIITKANKLQRLIFLSQFQRGKNQYTFKNINTRRFLGMTGKVDG